MITVASPDDTVREGMYISITILKTAGENGPVRSSLKM
jgi:hypothetical protein